MTRTTFPLRIALLSVLMLCPGACNSIQWPSRSPVTDAYSRNLEIALPAIAELGRSDRPEAVAVLQSIRQDADPNRRLAAENALRERNRRIHLAETEESPASVRAEIEAQHAVMEAKMRAGDLSGVAAHYADDGLVLGPGGRRVAGREAIDAYWKTFENPRDWELKLLDLEGHDGLYIERGRSKLTSVHEEQLRVSEVEYTLIWRRQPDGTLLIIVDAYW
jgi:ketosteroid isomerase-like protein